MTYFEESESRQGFHSSLITICLLVMLTSMICQSCSSSKGPTNSLDMSNAELFFDPDDPNTFQAIWSPTGDKMAIFASNRFEGTSTKISILDIESGTMQIFVDTTVSSPGQWVYPLTWSPDGKKLVIRSSGGSAMKEGIWIADADDFGTASYINDGLDAAWCDNGGLAIRKRNYLRKGEVFIFGYNLNSGFEKLLFSPRGNLTTGLSWSPDGTN